MIKFLNEFISTVSHYSKFYLQKLHTSHRLHLKKSIVIFLLSGLLKSFEKYCLGKKRQILNQYLK